MSGNVKKLCNYMYDCTRQAIKASAFNNLVGNKENKIIVINSDIFSADDKNIVEMMTKHALNKMTLNLLYSELIIKGQFGKNKFYTPLTYSEATLQRIGNKIKLETDGEQTLNIGIISNLLDGKEEEKIEAIISELLEVDIKDLIPVMSGLLNLDGLTIEHQKTLILAKLPESTAGLLNELKKIAEKF